MTGPMWNLYPWCYWFLYWFVVGGCRLPYWSRRVVLAEGVVSFGVHKLWEFLSRESERLEGVDEQVSKLKRELRML